MPSEFYDLEFDEYLLLREGYQNRLRTEQAVLKFQTALICEAFIGDGKGARYVNDAWQLEKREEMTADVVKKKLKQAKEKLAMRRMRK